MALFRLLVPTTNSNNQATLQHTLQEAFIPLLESESLCEMLAANHAGSRVTHWVKLHDTFSTSKQGVSLGGERYLSRCFLHLCILYLACFFVIGHWKVNMGFICLSDCWGMYVWRNHIMGRKMSPSQGISIPLNVLFLIQCSKLSVTYNAQKKRIN